MIQTALETMPLVFMPDDKKKLQLLKDTICIGFDDNQLALFVAVCNRMQLDPFSKQIHAVPRKNKETGKTTMTIQVGIDGYRITALRTGQYGGQDPKEWCGKDGKWVDIWMDAQPPVAARAKVYRKGIDRPFVAVVKFDEYAATYNGKPQAMWEKMPTQMIAKCAEALAIRMAFPYETAGTYEPAEIDNSPILEQSQQQPPRQQQRRPAAQTQTLKDVNPPAAAPVERKPYVYKPFERECLALITEINPEIKTTASRVKWLESYYSEGWNGYQAVNWESLHKDLQIRIDKPAFSPDKPDFDDANLPSDTPS